MEARLPTQPSLGQQWREEDSPIVMIRQLHAQNWIDLAKRHEGERFLADIMTPSRRALLTELRLLSALGVWRGSVASLP